MRAHSSARPQQPGAACGARRLRLGTGEAELSSGAWEFSCSIHRMIGVRQTVIERSENVARNARLTHDALGDFGHTWRGDRTHVVKGGRPVNSAEMHLSGLNPLQAENQGT